MQYQVSLGLGNPLWALFIGSFEYLERFRKLKFRVESVLWAQLPLTVLLNNV